MVNVFADSKRTFTFEDFFALKRLSNLKTSTTGNYLSVEVTTPDIEENTLNEQFTFYPNPATEFVTIQNRSNTPLRWICDPA